MKLIQGIALEPVTRALLVPDDDVCVAADRVSARRASLRNAASTPDVLSNRRRTWIAGVLLFSKSEHGECLYGSPE